MYHNKLLIQITMILYHYRWCQNVIDFKMNGLFACCHVIGVARWSLGLAPCIATVTDTKAITVDIGRL